MIVHIDASRALDAQPTGVNVYAREIIEHLVAGGGEFVLYAPNYAAHRIAEVFPQLVATDRVTWKILRWPPKFLWTQACLAWAWARASKKDAVFFSPAHVAPFFSPQNSVVVIHDIAFEFLPEAFSWRERMFARVMTRINAVRARKIIVPSVETQSQLVARYKISVEKIVVTPFALPRGAQQQTSTGAQTPPFSHPFILAVGRVEYKKGSDILIRAFEHMREQGHAVDLVFAGAHGVGFEKILAQVSRSEFIQDIHLLGFTSPEVLENLYRHARVLALPTRYEGFGFNFLEGMARGLPVVGFAHGSVAEVAGDGAALAHDEEEFFALLARATTDENFRGALITSGYARAALFSWKHTAELTRAVLYGT